MKKEKPRQMWVHPEFKRILKVRAVFDGDNLIGLTKRMAEELEKETFGEDNGSKKFKRFIE